MGRHGAEGSVEDGRIGYALFPVFTKLETAAVSGILAGVVQAAAFNPYDRALYLSITKNRDFFHAENWSAPFQGYKQALVQKSIQGGLYFPLEDACKNLFSKVRLPQGVREVIAGKIAGALNGLLVNPLSVIKYNMWSTNNTCFFKTAAAMFASNGTAPFLRGVKSTMLRDLSFGAIYTGIRHHMRRNPNRNSRRQDVEADLLAAVLGTIVSSPFNYARNVQYSAPAERIPNILQAWGSLMGTIQSKPTFLGQVQQAQKSLGIGWGTARVALGFAFGAFVYENLTRKATFHSHGVRKAVQ